ncbi:hypothetical protein KB976_004037 [Vibrio parahaemolyticus]|nr:hypothetical protein [Vibrio parahaemolyticus]
MPKSKLRKSRKKKQASSKPRQMMSVKSDVLDRARLLSKKMKELDTQSNFELEMPVVGEFYGGLSAFYLIERCSERHEKSGDFQVHCIDQSGRRYDFTAKQWELNRFSMSM